MEVEKVNFKKLFPDKKITQKKVLDFFDKKGSFIVLGLCLIIIGVTGYLVAFDNDGEEIITPDMMGNMDQSTAYFERDKEVIAQNQDEGDISVSDNEIFEEDYKGDRGETEGQASIEEQGDEALDGKALEEKSLEEGNEKVSLEGSAETALEDAVETFGTAGIVEAEETIAQDQEDVLETAGTPKFIMPVHGEIILEFAVDKLVFSKTLNEWRAHTGVGISSERGTPVKAVADGVVTSIKNDPRLGVTIIVEHSKDLKTVYANLASDDMVTPNQKVKQGEVIGCVGDTAAFKAADPSHLHFEVLKDNQPVNPVEYLPID